MRYLLDTCLISELQKARPSKAVCAWLAEQNEEDLYLSVLTFGEIQKGISQLPDGRKKARLQSWLDRDLRDRFRGRIAPVTEEVSLAWLRQLLGLPDAFEGVIYDTASISSLHEIGRAHV